MRFFELLCFFSFLYLSIMKIKYSIFRKIFGFILITFTFLDLIAILTKRHHIDFSFITNIDKDTFLFTINFFMKELIIILAVYLLLVLLSVLNDKKIYLRLKKSKQIFYIILLIVNVVFSFKSKSIVYSLKSIFDIHTETNIKSDNKKEVLSKLGIKYEDFIEKENILAEKGKNIVVIYLESLEKGFLDMKELTPNLNKLKNEWNYFKYETSPYSSWTMGAIYSTQTSFPMVLGLKSGNEVLKDATDNEGVSIGLTLNRAGYKQIFLGGASLKFAGKGNFFKLNNYEVFGNEEWDKNYPRNDWGIYDYDLFKEAKKKYMELSENGEPFNLTILTVDTHFPTGYPDERLSEYLVTKERNMEYCVEGTDYLVGDFIKFLKSQANYQNTSVYILTDHLMMGEENTVPVLKKLEKRKRELFLITNEKNIKGYEDKKDFIYFYDIPKLILNGSKVKTNVKFLNEMIPDINLEKIENTIKEYVKLNNSFYKIKYVELNTDLYLKRRSKNNKKLRIYSGSIEMDNILLSEERRMIYVFDKNMSFNPAYQTDKENMILQTQYGKLFLSLRLENEDIIIELISPDKKIYETQVIKNSKISNFFKKKIFNYEKLKDLSEKVDIVYSSDILEEIYENVEKFPKNEILVREENHKIIFYDSKNNIILREIKK